MGKSDFIELYTIETHSDGRYFHYVGWATDEEMEEPCGCFVPLEKILACRYVQDKWDLVIDAAGCVTNYGVCRDGSDMTDEQWEAFINEYCTPPDGYERLALSQLTDDTPDGYYYWN